MALPNEPFSLYVTNVVDDGAVLKISGQLDKQTICMIESLIESSIPRFEKGIGGVPSAAILEGIICAAKFKDGLYYRARIINTVGLSQGLVEVHFIDFGNTDIISLSTIRFLDSYDPMLLQLPGQASDYYLAGLINKSGEWSASNIMRLRSLLCYHEHPSCVVAQAVPYPIMTIQFQGNDLSQYLCSAKFGTLVSLEEQQELIRKKFERIPSNQTAQFSYAKTPNYTEHVPFLNNTAFPSNPASVMRVQHLMPSMPFSEPFTTPPPIPVSTVSKRLWAHQMSRAPVNLAAPMNQIQRTLSSSASVLRGASTNTSKVIIPTSPKTYKIRSLELNTQHKVSVSCADEGPELFSVQLVADAKKLENLMNDLNKTPHTRLNERPMIGTVCLGRMPLDRIIARAIVMDVLGTECKLFFVDFGDTELVSYYDIFDIPEEFVKPNVFALRFCLSGVKRLKKNKHLIENFKQAIHKQCPTLKVVPAEGPPLIQYGELYVNNQSVLDYLLSKSPEKLRFEYMELLPLGSRKSVLVSYVDSCVKFFVQLSDQIDQLNAVMSAVKSHCEESELSEDLPVGSACCAKFSDDGNWYRASIIDIKGNRATVSYIDYGNEQEVDMSDLRTITEELLQLPAQAIKCALKGFEGKPVETKTSNQLEMLALEKTLVAYVVGTLSTDIMLLTLVDDTTNPPLDIAKRMTQLSQPRISLEHKPTTPVRKDPPETFSSPEGSLPEDKRKSSYQREKSFKEERRPREEDFGNRGGSFRARDRETNGNFEKTAPPSFDRSGPGRHSEKFVPNKDRVDRYGGGGPKPWEKTEKRDDMAPAEEVQPFHRQNRDRRKPRTDQQSERTGPKAGWKSRNEIGPTKRLKQAAESDVTQAPPVGKTGSVQDRLRRDNNKDEWEENNFDDTKNKFDRRDNRPERRDNRDFRDNRSRDNWADKKRDFRDDRADRGGRSNFTPRDRADRPYTDDKKADRSFGSDGSNSYKGRSKFTQVQYKELSNPLPLETPFLEPAIEPSSQQEVSVTWIISPDSFYTQIMSLQPKFLEMMRKIPEIYKGVKPYSGAINNGASVLAKYPEDGVLYRATVISSQPFGKFIVQYIDFGNKFVVDGKDIWQLDQALIELPKMAVHCSLLGVSPKDGEWRTNSDIDLCLNAPRYQCIFQEFVEGKHKVSLWNDGVAVADMLVEKDLAVTSYEASSVTLKDEPIDLTIIIGQQIVGRVTHVESFEEFYVQLDMQKAALVQSAVENYDTSLLHPLPAETAVEGEHCTLVEEGKLRRALLAANGRAHLPDLGRIVDVAAHQLLTLPAELSVYYYQALTCRLNNYSADSHHLLTLEELRQRLVNNKFIFYINNVEDITLETTLYDCVSGQKIAIFEPDEGAYDEVSQLCMRTVFNYNFGSAYLVHAENLNEMYLQKSADSEAIAELLEDLFKFYEQGTPEAMENYEPESICAAKSSDGNWYRATIVSSTESNCKVQFSDYGNCETVPLDSVKKLDSKFYDPCIMALVASLGLVALQEDSVSKLIEWTMDKEVQVTLAIGNDGWLASLHLDGIDLSMKLVSEKLATPQIITSEDVKEEELGKEPISLPAGCTQVYISHIDTPGQFWLQMGDKIEKIDELQTELQEKSGSYGEVDNRDMGTLCIAKYTADDQWYRAEILDSDADITTVRFIDYGNTDVLDNLPELLKAIPDHLKDLERFAVKSSVNAVPTGTGQWSEPASDCFISLVGDLAEPLDALIILKDVSTYVNLFKSGQDLTDKLISEGHATRSDEPVCGDLPTCFASHVNTPSEFWIQLESATPELQAMEAAMVDAENFPELAEKEEGVICAAKYPEDGAWYRAQVIVDGSEGTEVLFMDYGNASIAMELRSLPEELKSKPALSRKCALQKPRDVKLWSRKSEMKFNDLAAEGATIFKVQFVASGDISIVELYHEGKSVTEELVALCEEPPQDDRPTPIGQELQSTGRICHVNSVEEFYVRLDHMSSNLNKVTEMLIDCQEFETVADLKIGSLCAAFWPEDEQWYRAKVLEFCEIGSLVKFIDYGNNATCEEFRQLPEELMQIEPLTKICSLAGLNELKSRGIADNKLKNIVAEDPIFQVQFLDSTKEPMLVKLSLNGEDLRTLIINAASTDTAYEEPMNENVSDEQCDELNTSQTDLNESVDSNRTVIENKMYNNQETEDMKINEQQLADTVSQPNEEVLESSSETLKSSGCDESKDSVNSDTGYTSDAERSSILSSPTDKNKQPNEQIIVSETKSDNIVNSENISVKADQAETGTKGNEEDTCDDNEIIAISKCEENAEIAVSKEKNVCIENVEPKFNDTIELDADEENLSQRNLDSPSNYEDTVEEILTDNHVTVDKEKGSNSAIQNIESKCGKTSNEVVIESEVTNKEDTSADKENAPKQNIEHVDDKTLHEKVIEKEVSKDDTSADKETPLKQTIEEVDDKTLNEEVIHKQVSEYDTNSYKENAPKQNIEQVGDKTFNEEIIEKKVSEVDPSTGNENAPNQNIEQVGDKASNKEVIEKKVSEVDTSTGKENAPKQNLEQVGNKTFNEEVIKKKVSEGDTSADKEMDTDVPNEKKEHKDAVKEIYKDNSEEIEADKKD